MLLRAASESDFNAGAALARGPFGAACSLEPGSMRPVQLFPASGFDPSATPPILIEFSTRYVTSSRESRHLIGCGAGGA